MLYFIRHLNWVAQHDNYFNYRTKRLYNKSYIYYSVSGYIGSISVHYTNDNKIEYEGMYHTNFQNELWYTL